MTQVEDAREFGEHIKHGGWRLGLLVARNVLPGTGNPAVTRDDRNASGWKISAATFGENADTSTARVMRYYRAWERAADAGHVPHADVLATGQEVTLPDADALPWSNFYDATQAGGRPRDSRPVDAVTIIERRGLANVVAAMPEDMQRELFHLLGSLIEREHAAHAAAPIHDGADGGRLRTGSLMLAVLKADRRLHDALAALRTGEVDTIDTDDRERLHLLIGRIRQALDLLDMAAGGGVDDAALEAWLSDGAS